MPCLRRGHSGWNEAWVSCQTIVHQVSNEKKPGGLFYIGDYTTQLDWD